MTRRPRSLSSAVGIAALATMVAACGTSDGSGSRGNGDGAAASSRAVEIAMEDIRFDPNTITVRAGETIDFRFTNNGAVTHDALVGDRAAQMDHAAEMEHMGDMGGHMTGSGAITIEPGDTGELSYTFDQPGTYEIGCHQPGHYDAGMKVDVTVE